MKLFCDKAILFTCTSKLRSINFTGSVDLACEKSLLCSIVNTMRWTAVCFLYPRKSSARDCIGYCQIQHQHWIIMIYIYIHTCHIQFTCVFVSKSILCKNKVSFVFKTTPLVFIFLIKICRQFTFEIIMYFRISLPFEVLGVKFMILFMLTKYSIT